MNATMTDATCQVCERAIERLSDTIYVNWELKGTPLARPNHKACAQAQYARNRRLTDGYVECIACGGGVLDLTANRLGGRCRSCQERTETTEAASAEAVEERPLAAMLPNGFPDWDASHCHRCGEGWPCKQGAACPTCNPSPLLGAPTYGGCRTRLGNRVWHGECFDADVADGSFAQIVEARKRGR